MPASFLGAFSGANRRSSSFLAFAMSGRGATASRRSFELSLKLIQNSALEFGVSFTDGRPPGRAAGPAHRSAGWPAGWPADRCCIVLTSKHEFRVIDARRSGVPLSGGTGALKRCGWIAGSLGLALHRWHSDWAGVRPVLAEAPAVRGSVTNLRS